MTSRSPTCHAKVACSWLPSGSRTCSPAPSEARIDADLALGRHERAVTELGTLIARYPLRERLREQLMLALYRSGRQADALAAYQDARHAFADELGLDPGPALSALEGAILRHDPSLLPGRPAAPPSVVR